jgi:DNA-directed RNA polymerase subunit RPC12/RpoP
MNYVCDYQSSTDIYIYMCAGCGREFEVSDSISPLDGLGYCSAECDLIVEARFERTLAADPE